MIAARILVLTCVIQGAAPGSQSAKTFVSGRPTGTIERAGADHQHRYGHAQL